MIEEEEGKGQIKLDRKDSHDYNVKVNQIQVGLIGQRITPLTPFKSLSNRGCCVYRGPFNGEEARNWYSKWTG